MRSTRAWSLVLLATCGVTTAIAGVGCGDDDTAAPPPAGKAGSSGSAGGNGTAGKAGAAGTGGSAGAAAGTGGSAGAAAGTGGSAGAAAGTGGSAGAAAGTGGSAGAAAGTGGSAGAAAGTGGSAGAAAGTGGSAGAGGSVPVGNPSLFPSAGSAVAVAEDDSRTVMVNRDVGSVSVFKTTYAADGTSVEVVKTAEVSVGVGSEPWQVALSPDGKTAYVVLRKDQKLVRISNLDGTPTVSGSVVLGSEPTGIALTPSGTRAWITNWVDGTVMGVDTAALTVTSTIDLNGPLAASGLLGANVTGRPGLAHPRSIAITNNKAGGDQDETLLVTEYFAQRTAPLADKGANADGDHSGVVYSINNTTKAVTLIKLAPIADMGFKDSTGGTAGCFPNQLQSITVNGTFAYVTSICASPKGPVGATADTPPKLDNIKTTTHGAVSVIDLTTGLEATAATMSLHAKFDAFMGATAGRRMPNVPVDISFLPGAEVAYIAANGADAVFRVAYEGAASPTVGAGIDKRFINLTDPDPASPAQGQLPIGVAVAKTGKKFAFVANDASRNLSVIDLATQAVSVANGQKQVLASAALPVAGSPEDKIRLGKKFFNTGIGRWSLAGEGWGACQSCHVDGLTDNVTWYFGRGPRQSTSLDASFSKKDPNDQRIFNWTAIFDEVADFEGNTRGTSGGVGAIVSAKSSPPVAADRIDLAAAGHNHAGLNGSATQAADPANPAALPAASVLSDWADIKAYMQSIRSPRGVTGVPQATIDAGKQAFIDGACAGCHSGDKWTISKVFYTPNKATTAALGTTAWTAPGGFPTSLLPATDPAKRFMRFSDGAAGAFDQIQCILRPVGTFGVADASAGLAAELRQNMSTAAQGNEANGNGFNPPGLIGGVIGAPYLHAGGARTLESLFSSTFKGHHQALAPNFLIESDPAVRKTKIDALVAYLTSIDQGTAAFAIPVAGANGGNFCAPPP